MRYRQDIGFFVISRKTIIALTFYLNCINLIVKEVIMKKLSFIVLMGLLIALVILGVACSGSDPEPDRPEIPGSETVTTDFSAFTSASSARPMETCAHFDTAAAFVVVWGSLTQLFLALPRIAFVLALSQEPIYDGDMKWTWTFGADTNNISLSAQIVEDDSVEWEMRVTNTELSNFLWYDGKCDFHAVGGWWRFYDVDDGAALWIGWQDDTGDTTAELTLANINTVDPNYGDSLHYEVDGEMANVWLRDIDGGRPGRWNVTWNLLTYYGQIIYPEETSGCWDEALECIPCDSIPVN